MSIKKEPKLPGNWGLWDYIAFDTAADIAKRQGKEFDQEFLDNYLQMCFAISDRLTSGVPISFFRCFKVIGEEMRVTPHPKLREMYFSGNYPYITNMYRKTYEENNGIHIGRSLKIHVNVSLRERIAEAETNFVEHKRYNMTLREYYKAKGRSTQRMKASVLKTYKANGLGRRKWKTTLKKNQDC